MTPTRSRSGRGWALGALGFAAGYGLLRLYWAAGGRWGYTACDRTRSPGAAELSTGCGAEQLATLPLWRGWGAVALCCVLAAVAALLALGRGRAAQVGAWGACAALVALSFPLHLLFEIPAAVSGRPTDWLDVVDRLLLLGGGLLFGMAAAPTGPRRCAHPRVDGPQPVTASTRRWAYAGVAVPVLGWTVPHALWLLGVPFGIPADDLAAMRQDIDLGSAVAITVAPALGSLLTLGLAQRWGQVFPCWVPRLAGRRVPRLLAVVPAGVVAAALTAYGLVSAGVMTTALVTGATTWSQLAAGWAVAATLLVFIGWGAVLGAATLGYHRVTRPHCELCGPSGR
jgi:hypothetical protein